MSFNIRIKDSVNQFTKRMFYVLFDEDRSEELMSLNELFQTISHSLEIPNGVDVWEDFCHQIPEIRNQIDLDAKAIERHDPASKSVREVYLSYPGFYAIAIYRLSNSLLKLGVPIVPRMMSEYVHGKTGIDIHPGATIGKSFFIDHGTGIVIGETSIIKDNVKIYQGVTLGGIQVKKELAATKRHPTIEDNVTIYANATILGGEIVIGADSIIGANVWITRSVPPNSLVTYKTEINITQRKGDK
ncbi:serine O-acetyltransferase EpsC [Aegicerativicinus sediminis]|uniref:serine O-acetyltransferase EpsC n=1 Tax=Aegicerativicinus sediminis TaxID=2893202 RepID=UPI001E566877|nr:serine O-acetyltransferase EpsC [Aegicerativicinus sediminis]